MSGRANASREWLCGGQLLVTFTSSRVDAVILQGWGEQGATREHGQHGRAWSRVAFGHEQFSRGVNSNDKDLLWLLAPTKLTDSGTGRCDKAAHFQNAEPLAKREFASGSGFRTRHG